MGSDTSAAASEPSRTLRSGEAMLADMARALNAGLGLTEAGSEPQADGAQAAGMMRGISPLASSSDRSHPPPAEGSFERFLINLQADLRTLLSEDSISSSTNTNEDGSSDDPASSSASSPTPEVSSEGEDAEISHAASHSQLPSDETVESGETRSEAVEDGGDDADDEDRPPSLATASDSVESEFDVDVSPDDHEAGHTDQAEETMVPEGVQPHPRVPTPIPSMWTSNPSYSETTERVSRTYDPDQPESQSGEQASTSRLGSAAGGERERSRPAINLWRLYRFAPIPASQALETASVVRPLRSHAPSSVDASTSTNSFASSAAAPTEHPAPRSQRMTPGEVPITGGGVANVPTETASVPITGVNDDPTTNMPTFVVPVIVVGLQSVDAPNVDDEDDMIPPTQSSSGEPSEAGPSRVPSDSATPWASALPPGAASASSANARSWGSRAANALRGLRPARRSSRTSRSTDGSGSRTFLIYVIGGTIH